MDAVPLLSESMAVPIVSRSLANSVVSRSNLSRAPENRSPSLSSVARTVSRLSTSCSSAALLSASEFENDDVLLSNDCNVSPWPWKIWSNALVSALTSVGVQAPDHRFEPAEQQVEVERRLGAVRPESARRASSSGVGPGAVEQFEIAVADEVEVADRCPRAGGEYDIVVGVEGHQYRVVVAQRSPRRRCRPARPRPGRSRLPSGWTRP